MGRSILISLNTTQAHIQTPSRMNKLLMLAFLVTLMGLMATAAPQEDVEELELEDYSEDEADSLEEVAESREGREAGRNREPYRGRNCRNKRPKVGRSGKKRTRNGKAKLQNKSAKKNKKSKNSKPKKSIKGERRGNNGNGVSRSQCRSTDYTCLLNAMTYLNLTKTQVTNYLKQQGRIVAANKTGEKKNGKKGIFASTAQRIIRSGGGNSAALSCQGSTTSNGAMNLTSLATLLNGCEDKVKMACATENMPLPNMTEVSACVSSMETFKGMVDKCQMMKDNGTEACSCWSNDNFTALVTIIKGCKISSDQKLVIAQLSSCKGNFSACKQAEDDGMKAMSSCSTSKAALLASAKTLSANSAGLDSAKTTVDSLAGNTSTRAAAASCAEIITIVTEITTIVASNPENSTVTTLTTKITSATGLTCSDAEKTSLATSSSDLASAKESVDGSLATIKEDLEIATGSAPTDSEISSATTAAASSATSTSSARRNIVARHLLNRFNLN